MYYHVRHSIPGRIRLEYDKRRIDPIRAALAENLIAVQEGITAISFNSNVGTFLVYYDISKLSECEVLAFFSAIDGRYLDDPSMLASVREPDVSISLAGTLVSMTVSYALRKLLPVSIRSIMRVWRAFPRVMAGAKCLLSGHISDTRVLDAAAISVAIASGNSRTADNIGFLLSVGETIEEYTKRKSLDDLAITMFSGNESVHVLAGGDTEEVRPLSAVRKGDVIIARTGDVIQADGSVAKGEALVNQATITGEPLAVEKREGSTVFAGTVVEEGEIYVCVRQIGSQTKVSRILAEIGSSNELKVSSQKNAEILADRLVKYNFLFTALTFLFTRNTAKVLSTLMVDYSCAMKLAAPIAVLSAMKEAAEHGLLVKGGRFLEEAAKADTVVFDKTGTLTNASPMLSRIINFSARSDDEILRLAACLEEHYAHPIARAIVRAADERNLEHPEKHAKVEYIVAHGIASYVADHRVLVGSRHFVINDEHSEAPDSLDDIHEEAIKRGESLLYLAEDGHLIALFALSDPVRTDAAQVILKLRESGVYQCVMITGDDEGAAKSVAENAGLDRYISRALPEDKSRYVKDCRDDGHKVIMLGDGINDAPALAAADVGVAMGSIGSDIAVEAADIALMSDDISKIPYLKRLSNATVKTIKFSITLSMCINFVAIVLSLLEMLTPVTGALVHNAGSCFVVLIAALLYDRKFE